MELKERKFKAAVINITFKGLEEIGVVILLPKLLRVDLT